MNPLRFRSPSFLRPRTFACLSLLALAATLAAADVSTADEPTRPAADTGGPRLVILGTAQDGGLPHAGCHCERCTRARREPGFARRVASLGIVLPASQRVFLVDATPDLPAQLETLARYRPAAGERVDRSFLAGIFLTHAHIGHYLGLAQLGFEVMHTEGVPVYATPRLAAFLRDNGPWSQLVRLGEIVPKETPPASPVVLGEGVSVTSLPVPHRDEYSDTVAYVISGPRSRVLYVPDTDAWRSWERPLAEVLDGIDVALLDGTFYSGDELPGRDVSKVPHPLIRDTVELLAPRVVAGTLRVLFIHLNHSNPALVADSAARRELESKGFAVAADGQGLPL